MATTYINTINTLHSSTSSPPCISLY